MDANPFLEAPKWLISGDTAWQLTAATFVGMQSIPGLAILYGGLVKKKWALNSVVMVFYAFAVVLLTWTLLGYNMSFGHPLKLGPGILSSFIGVPVPALSPYYQIGRSVVPLAASSLPDLHFSGSVMIYFQFVFAAIAPILIAGSLFGRMNFKAWMLFVPLWSLIVYSIGAFALWGGVHHRAQHRRDVGNLASRRSCCGAARNRSDPRCRRDSRRRARRRIRPAGKRREERDLVAESMVGGPDCREPCKYSEHTFA